MLVKVMTKMAAHNRPLLKVQQLGSGVPLMKKIVEKHDVLSLLLQFSTNFIKYHSVKIKITTTYFLPCEPKANECTVLHVTL